MDYVKSEDLFIKAYHFNWDDGLKSLSRILSNTNCDFGTALLIYWRARPESLYEYKSIDEVPDVNRELYSFTVKLEEKLLSQKYQEYISFDPKDEYGAINETVLKREIPLILREKSKGDINGSDLISGKIGVNAWYKAAKEGDIETLERILNNSFDINKADTGGTALHYCVDNLSLDNSKKIKTIDFLLANGIKINKKSKYGCTAIDGLPFLYKEESLEIVKYLISKGANPHIISGYGCNPIFTVCRARNYSILKYFLSIGVDPHIIRKYNHDTPFHMLFDFQTRTERECLPLVELLIEYKVDPRVLNSSGESVLQLAKKNKPTVDLEKAITALESYINTYQS